MKTDWWVITVNGNVLITVNGYDTARFMYKYLSQDLANSYNLVRSAKNNTKKEVQPVPYADIIHTYRK